MCCVTKVNGGQVIRRTGPKLIDRPALKSQKERELNYILFAYTEQPNKAITEISSGCNTREAYYLRTKKWYNMRQLLSKD
jgi:hypothetical protein